MLSLAVLDREERGVGERVLRLRKPSLQPLQGCDEHPALEESLAILPLGREQLALLQAALGRGHRAIERGRGIGFVPGGKARGEEKGEGEQEPIL